jgi:hypothetical protein
LEISCIFPFLKQGLTMANFNISGKMAVPSTALQICVSGEIINGALDFIILLDISSYPLEFFFCF